MHPHLHSSVSDTAHSSLCYYTPLQRARTPVFAATHILSGLALRRVPAPPLLCLSHRSLWHLLPPTFTSGWHSDFCCYTHSQRSSTPACTHTSTPPSQPLRAPASAATHLCGGLALWRLLPPHLLGGLTLLHLIPSQLLSSHALWCLLLPQLFGGCMLLHLMLPHLLGGLALWRLLPPHLLGGLMLLCLMAPNLLSDLALWCAPAPPILRLGSRMLQCLLPHAFPVGSRSGV